MVSLSVRQPENATARSRRPSHGASRTPSFRSRRGRAPAQVLARPCPPPLGLAYRIDHRRGDRLRGRFAAPDDELKGGIETLTFRKSDIDQILDLFGARRGYSAQQHGVTEGRGILLRREIEMTEPQLLIGGRQKL